MKKDVHLDYTESVFRCACGSEFITRSTKPKVFVEVCKECRPFDGKQKVFDSAGQIEKFMKRFKINEKKKEDQ